MVRGSHDQRLFPNGHRYCSAFNCSAKPLFVDYIDSSEAVRNATIIYYPPRLFYSLAMQFWNWFHFGSKHSSHDLQRYLQHATLPGMTLDPQNSLPPRGHKSHKNTLEVRSEKYRTFQSIERLQDETINEAIAQCEYLSYPTYTLK